MPYSDDFPSGVRGALGRLRPPACPSLPGFVILAHQTLVSHAEPPRPPQRPAVTWPCFASHRGSLGMAHLLRLARVGTANEDFGAGRGIILCSSRSRDE